MKPEVAELLKNRPEAQAARDDLAKGLGEKRVEDLEDAFAYRPHPLDVALFGVGIGCVILMLCMPFFMLVEIIVTQCFQVKL